MAFDSLTEKLQNIFKNLRSKGRLTEDDVKEALKEIKRALLAADVNFKVVKDFIKNVQERAIGQDVMNGLNPGQMVIKIVNEELVKSDGLRDHGDRASAWEAQITVIMMAGLQGAGKTTTTAKAGRKVQGQRARTLFWWPAMYTVRRRSSSCRLTARSRVWKCSPWARAISRPTLPKRRSSMRRRTATGS
ncbi:MAG: signal recognition particle receptor subunit alpha [[Clostridium] scindens]